MVSQKYLKWILLAVFILAGFWFRYIGISQGLSYWNDEGNAALFARGVFWHGLPVTEVGKSAGIYQIGFYYLTALFFKLFSVNEFVGRLPSVFAGTALIVIIFLISKKILGLRQAWVAGFLVAFSQIQLAWSTQLRPYIWLELFTLLITYFSYRSLENKKAVIERNLIYAVIFSLIASLFHGTGLINFLLVSLVLFYKVVKTKRYVYLLAAIPLGLVTILFMYFSFSNTLPLLFKFDFNTMHYRIFLTHNYWWLLMGAMVGTYSLLKANRKLAYLLGSFVVIIFFLAIFKINSQYVRYSLPAFPLLYILFSEGLVYSSDKISVFVKKEYKIYVSYAIIIFILLGTIFTGKVLVAPKYYYSINADMRENPIVDYKLAFLKINRLLNGKNNSVVMDAWNDRVPWYMPGQKFVFLLKDGDEKIDPFYGERLIGTIKEFEDEEKMYSSGIVIVEDWPSLTPPKLQDHIRKTLKHEFDVQDLPYNENDHWGISVYSWGLDK